MVDALRGVAEDDEFSKDTRFAKTLSDTREIHCEENVFGLTETTLQVGSDIRGHEIDPCCVYPATKQQTAR